MKFTMLILIATIFSGSTVFAQSIDCGNIPDLPVKYQEMDKLKGDISGEAQLLSKKIGNADLKGAVEEEHNVIYQTADQTLAAWKAASLYHMFCEIVMSDKSFSTQQKIDAIIQFKQGMEPRKSGDIIQLKISPSQEASPPNPCAEFLKPNDVTFFYGTNAAIASVFPHVVLRIEGRDIISLNKNAAGELMVSMDILGDDGRVIAKLKDNLLTVNPNNFYSIARPDRSSLIVYDRHQEKALDIKYVNEAAIKIEGIIHYQGRIMEISSAAANTGPVTIRASCSAHSGGADIVIGSDKV